MDFPRQRVLGFRDPYAGAIPKLQHVVEGVPASTKARASGADFIIIFVEKEHKDAVRLATFYNLWSCASPTISRVVWVTRGCTLSLGGTGCVFGTKLSM